jgi:hypothetical protein
VLPCNSGGNGFELEILAEEEIEGGQSDSDTE